MYVSPQSKIQQVTNFIDTLMTTIDYNGTPLIIMGDLNMKSIANVSVNYNEHICQFMNRNYGLRQYIQSNTTKHHSMLDLCFSNVPIETTTIWNHWSDHHMIVAYICNND